MTAILLDTNVLLRLVSAPTQVPVSAREILADQANELVVSAASAWEVAVKTRIGRLEGGPLLASWVATLADMGATDLPIGSVDAVLAGQLDWSHKDPFDRMIVAQATRRNLTIATSDGRMIRDSPTPVIDIRA